MKNTKGDALLQKKFTIDFLNKKMKINEGEVPQYYVENSHPPSSASKYLNWLSLRFKSELKKLESQAADIASRAGCVANAAAGISAVRFGIQPASTVKFFGSVIINLVTARECATPHIYEKQLIPHLPGCPESADLRFKYYSYTCKTLLDSLFQDPALLQKQKDAELAYEKAHNVLADSVEANKWQLSDQTEYQKTYTALEKAAKEQKLSLNKRTMPYKSAWLEKIRSTSSSVFCLSKETVFQL